MTTEIAKPRAKIATYASDDAYHADRSRLSGSNLDRFDRNPAEFLAWKNEDDDVVDEQTVAMAGGSLFHCLCLEPGELAARFEVEPEDPKNPGRSIHRGTKAYKEWRTKAKRSGKTVVKPEQMTALGPMVDALVSVPAIKELLTCEGGLNEVALHFDIEDRAMRCKLDRVIPDRGIIVELKTCTSAEPDEKTAWQWERFGYARKAALYLEAYRQVWGKNATMIHIFVESGKTHPRTAMFYTQADSPAAQWGESEYLRVLVQMQLCEAAGDFRSPFEPGAPGYQPLPLPLPGPILRQLEFLGGGPVELDIDGSTVTL